MRCHQQFTFHRCTAYLRARPRPAISSHGGRAIRSRTFSSGLQVPSQHKRAQTKGSGQEKRNGPVCTEEGSMSRRLSEMADEAMLEGGNSSRKTMQEAGFSEDLKRKLEVRIAESTFRSENAAAFSLANMTAAASRRSQDIAAAAPWAGTESIHDVSFRMLHDAIKPMRIPFKPPQPGPQNLQRTMRKPLSSGERLANARDRTSTYALSQDPKISKQEREAIHSELQERFTPGARAITPHGLSSLANERIEDAIARGQFRNIQRGKGINPYIDTTEYLLNKIIQKQEITPPWIEKQQELAKEVERFRKRVRSDWRRRAVRLISSQGGSLESQILRARGYAATEARLGSPRTNEATVNESDGEVHADIEQTIQATNHPHPGPQPPPFTPPLRDPDWLKIEQAYHNLAVKSLNALTRSYNLMAPPVAQKAYLNLERELLSCYADVASSLPAEMQRRATDRTPNPNPSIPRSSHMGGFLKNLSLRQNMHLHEEDPSKRYGFKQFWRDIWNRNDTAAG
ncbi:hypothetical protein ACJ72_00511 [Emergomyces africanus]|uniref:DnaJ homologue subfamily C member 28 conserved domain-containing protein n=1 Tax=Emergomyces africanus TaxID=1955775 RepID=A0A1B7P7Y2_9EURO|nr:hypothetical protein ACJ72_00511 [Emergomyces africanus]